jgi:hypothetical protein
MRVIGMRKFQSGVLLGVCAGIVDVVPMIVQSLTWDAILSAFSLWVVSGIFIASSNLKVNGAVKGIIISVLTLLPAAVLIGWKEPASLLPIAVMTLILGSLLGYGIERYAK